jgi:hypothetical protein
MKLPLLFAIVAFALSAFAQQQDDQKQALANNAKKFDDAFNATMRQMSPRSLLRTQPT